MTFTYKLSKTTDADGIQLISFDGELIERFQAKELFEEFEELITEGHLKFILDLEKIKYLNSSGLSVILTMFTKSRNSGGELIICNVSSRLKELLVITKLNSIFTLTENIDSAKDHLRQE